MCLRISCCPTFDCSSKESSVRKSTMTRLYYLVIFVTIVIVSFILYAYGEKAFGWIPGFKELPDGVITIAAVYKLLFGLFVFHFILGLLMLGVSNSQDPRAVVQDGVWLIKIILLVAIIIGSYFLPNEALQPIGILALMGAAVFVLIQQLLLVDFAHNWNYVMVMKWTESGENSWFAIILATTFVMYSFALTVSIVIYVLFSKCNINLFFTTFNLVAFVVVTCCSISPAVQDKTPHSGLLQSSVVAAYTTYLVFSAVLSESGDDWQCNPKTSSSADDVTTVVGAFFSLVAVAYSALRVAGSQDALAMGGEASEPLKGAEAGKAPVDGGGSDDQGADEEAGGVLYSYSFFHFTFSLAAMYAMMIITNWQVLGGADSAGQVSVNQGTAAVWVQIVASWICLSLYGWTLMAPVAFPDREFSFH